MITRLIIYAAIIFAITMAVIYGYRKMATEHSQHTVKIAIGGVITFALIAGISVLEGT